MCSEELGLRLAAIPTLSVPPARSVGVQYGPLSAGDIDVFTLNLE
jgi:hypothetical protein